MDVGITWHDKSLLEELSNRSERTGSRMRKICAISLESVVDMSLWFLHAALEIPRTLNDINIWERSALFESMTNGEQENWPWLHCWWASIFQLFYLVDGIYPCLTHFLGTATDLITQLNSSCAMDQDAARKDVEQGFGVLKLNSDTQQPYQSTSSRWHMLHCNDNYTYE